MVPRPAAHINWRADWWLPPCRLRQCSLHRMVPLAELASFVHICSQRSIVYIVHNTSSTNTAKHGMTKQSCQICSSATVSFMIFVTSFANSRAKSGFLSAAVP